jgi:hypothetical protein
MRTYRVAPTLGLDFVKVLAEMGGYVAKACLGWMFHLAFSNSRNSR